MKPLNLINKAFFLKKTALFGALDLDTLLSIADKMEMLHFKEEERVFQVGQEAHRMYCIVEGEVALCQQPGHPRLLLGRGEFFGDESLFNERPRGYEVCCVQPTVLLSLARTHLLAAIGECPSIALALLEAYAAPLTYRPRLAPPSKPVV